MASGGVEVGGAAETDERVAGGEVANVGLSDGEVVDARLGDGDVVDARLGDGEVVDVGVGLGSVLDGAAEGPELAELQPHRTVRPAPTRRAGTRRKHREALPATFWRWRKG